MTTTFKINANDINLLVLDTIKAYYAGKEIEISIKEYTPMPQTELTTPSPMCNASNVVTKSHAQKITPLLTQQLTRLVDELRFPILAGLVVCGINLVKIGGIRTANRNMSGHCIGTYPDSKSLDIRTLFAKDRYVSTA